MRDRPTALAAAAAAGLAIAGFLINSLSSLAEGLKPWRLLPLWDRYVSSDPLRNGLDAGNAAMLPAFAAAMGLAALVAFQHRAWRPERRAHCQPRRGERQSPPSNPQAGTWSGP